MCAVSKSPLIQGGSMECSRISSGKAFLSKSTQCFSTNTEVKCLGLDHLKTKALAQDHQQWRVKLCGTCYTDDQN